MAAVISKAGDTGTGVVVVRNTSSAAAMGYYAAFGAASGACQSLLTSTEGAVLTPSPDGSCPANDDEPIAVPMSGYRARECLWSGTCVSYPTVVPG
jgi:LDH2 family malate/lactate/ureidoglycolate dehydrogenase